MNAPLHDLRAACPALARAAMRVLALALALAPAAHAEGPAPGYPARPVRIIVPFLPGGAVDSIARVLAQRLGEQLGQPFVVENRPGANGAIGSDLVAKSAADGYTLLVQASTLIINPLFQKSNPYDVARDFSPVSELGEVPMVFVAYPELNVRDLAGFLGLARARPGQLTIGAASLGSPGHLAEAAIRHQAGVNLVIASYKGTAGVLNDLLGGHVDGSVDALPAYLPPLKAGKLRALAVTTAHRVPLLPEVPTVAESGLAGFEMVSWYGLWGPAHLPAGTLQRLAEACAEAVHSQLAAERLVEQGFVPVGSLPGPFAAYIAAESGKYARLVREARISLEAD